MKPEIKFDRVLKKEDRITILWQPNFHYCNYDCFYCPVKKPREDQKHFDWDKELFLSVLNKIVNFPFQVDLIIGPGGEPFISKTIRDAVCTLTNSKNIKSLLILSNIGVKKAVFESFLKNCNIKKLSIAAAYHSSEEKNIERYLDKILYLKNKGVSIVGILVAVPDEKTFELILKLRKKFHSMNVPFFPTGLQGNYNGKVYPNSYTDEQKKFLKKAMGNIIDYEYKIDIKKPGLCDAGRSYFHLAHDGTVSTCMFLRKKMGNIFSSIPKLSSVPIECDAKTCICQIEYWNTIDFKERYIHSTQNLHIYREKKWIKLRRNIQSYKKFFKFVSLRLKTILS